MVSGAMASVMVLCTHHSEGTSTNCPRGSRVGERVEGENSVLPVRQCRSGGDFTVQLV